MVNTMGVSQEAVDAHCWQTLGGIKLTVLILSI